MEKRVLLALVLSLMVLVTWNMLFPVSQRNVSGKKIQVIENKEFVKELTDDFSSKSPAVSIPKEEKAPEEIVVMNNGKISLEFTTRGGLLKKATILDYNAEIPVSDIFQLKDFNGVDYVVEEKDARSVVFFAKKEGWEVRRKFVFSDEDFLIEAQIQLDTVGNEAEEIDPRIMMISLDMARKTASLDNSRDKNLLEYSVFSQNKVFRKTGAYKFTPKDNKRVEIPVDWFGFRDRYFCVIAKPEFAVDGYETFSENSDGKALSMNAFLGNESFPNKGNHTLSSTIYIGPQNARILKKYDLSFEKIQVYFGAAFMDAIAKIIEDLMIVMYKIIPNWGVSIILVSLLIYFAMYPMTMKSMLSMRKMQSLQPKIMELRTKYEKNPQKLNQEIMKMYAENKVNPLGGCLPLLLQMPVFICLYQMIWRSILFKGADFLWIKDLSEPDRLFILNQNFPVIGNEVNLLPVIILILMVLQQKMTSKNMVATDPNQLAQQKMMTFMMPAVLLLVFYKIASGLTLYLVVFYVMSSFTQWRVSRITSKNV